MQEEYTHPLRKILIIIYIVYLGLYCGLDALLSPCGIEFRTWFQVISLLYLWLFPVVGIAYLIYAWREKQIEERMSGKAERDMVQNRAFRWGTGLFLFAYGLAMMIVSLFLLVLMIFSVDSEKRLDEGILRVEKMETMYGGEYSYYEPVAFFFRKKIDGVEYPDSWHDENEEIGNNEKIRGYKEIWENQKMNLTETGYSDRQYDFVEEYQEKKDNARYLNVYDGDQPLADAVWLIYEKHYVDNPNSESEMPCFSYNAKGNFYAEVMGKDHSCVLLVYNGVSENGKCQLFVAEEEHYDVGGSQLDNTSLLEFYAVNLEEGQVYEAHKDTWGGAESEEYRKATEE